MSQFAENAQMTTFMHILYTYILTRIYQSITDLFFSFKNNPIIQ